LNEGSDYAADVLGALRRSEAIVPSVWPLEVCNALMVAERKRRLTTADIDEALGILLALPIALDPGSRNEPFKQIRGLARTRHLSAYDASYLDLALRRKLPLATLDEPLRKAAEQEGVPLFEPG
jgi:predicted nucleic acid-binding protein